MLPILALATLAVTTPAPIDIQFTSDSVYTYESILTPKEVKEQEDGKYTLVFEQDKLLGYQIYDKEDTAYLDGLKFDDEFVTNYIVKDVDLSVEHHILIKTVYTEDIAGMLAAAKDGDWSRALSNPLILFQLGYYILAAISIIAGGFGLLKSKAKKAKNNDEIAKKVDTRAEAQFTAFKEAIIESVVKNLITPVMTRMQTQQNNITKALVLSQSNDPTSKMALLDVLKSEADEDVNVFAEGIAKQIESTAMIKAKAKEEADKAVKEIITGIFLEDDKGGIGI